MTRKILYDEWLELQKRKARQGRSTFRKVFIGERSYPHLDGKLHYPRIGHDVTQAAWLETIVTMDDKLAGHGFLPFIRNDKRQRKFKEPPHDYEYSSARGGRDQRRFPHIKSRPIMYASHRDACIFSFYAHALQSSYEQKLTELGLQNNVIAYRSIDGKNNVDFAKEAFDEMHKRDEYDCIMLDVKSFFDTLAHPLLSKRWEGMLDGGFTDNPDHRLIFSRITEYRYLNFNEAVRQLKFNKRSYLIKEEGCLKLCSQKDYNSYLKKMVATNRTGIGIPQGSPISGVLANLYLLDFDTVMRNLVVSQHGGVYQRYSDDIFILCPMGRAKEIYDELQRLLAQEQLALGIGKTEAFRKKQGETKLQNVTTEIESKGNSGRDEAQYLGFHFDGQTISFRPSTLSKHVRGRRKPDYLKGAYQKTLSSKVARQVNKIRRVVRNRGTDTE